MADGYRFGEFTLDQAGHRLLRGEEEVELPPKAFDLLVYLVVRAGVVVGKQELLDELWPDVTVTENTLAQRIKEVRTALGDDAGEPRFLRTIARVGYKFIGPVEPWAPHADHTTTLPARGPGTTKRRWQSAAASLGAIGTIGLLAFMPERPDGLDIPAPTQQLISTLPGSHRQATFSPDGRTIAFEADAGGLPQIWVQSMAEGDPMQITFGDEGARRPRWSPLNDRILFERGSGIWGVPPLGGTPHQVLREASSAAFSADGTQLVFERRRRLWISRADGSDERALHAAPEWTFAVDSSPALSPDGRWVAIFVQEAGPHGDFWKVPVDGTAAVRLTFDLAEGGTPVWTPDGGEILFSSNRSGARTLWRIPSSGGEPRPVTAGAGEDREPSVSPDGRRLIYTTVRPRWTVELLDVESGTRTVLLERRSALWLPAFSPAGDRIAFFQSMGPSVHLFTMGADGRHLRQVTRGDRQRLIHPSFSADGAWLFYYQDHPQPYSFRKMPADGGASTEVVSGWRWTSHINGQVSPDGARAVVTRQTSQDGTTVLRDLASGQETELPGPHLHGMRWSSDGAEILGWRHDGTMAVCPANAGPCRTIGRGVRPVWSADGRAVYFHRAAAEPAHFELWSMRSDGTDERKLGLMGPMHPLSPVFDISPAGLSVSTGFQPGRSELWAMELGED